MIPDNSIDMILVDPPYGTTYCRWDTIIPFDAMWEQYKRITKENSAICIFGAEPFSSTLRLSNIKMYRYDWVWIKDKGSDPLNANRRPLNNIENVSVFYKRQPTYNPQMRSGKPYIAKADKSRFGDHLHDKNVRPVSTVSDGGRFPLRNLYFPRDNQGGKSFHPTQKPVALLEYLIKTYTDTGGVILDNCMGSGSTGVACVQTGRQFIGIENDAGYYNIAKERILAARQLQHA